MTDHRRTKVEKDTIATSAYTPGVTGDDTYGFTTSVGAEAMTAPPGYEILGLLGRGGMGVVYRARQLSLHRVVALKTIALGPRSHPSAAARFEQEAQTVARLQHPHIVAAYDFGSHDGRLYLAMEFVEGQDMEDLIRERGKLDEPTTWGLIRQAAAGLAHAASFGIVHRDVKPANMLLVPPPAGFPLPPGLPMLKLTDFGLAFLADDRRNTRLTAENTTLGSPHYMAPEQVMGASVDHRTDIYGLGATAYHMLTGTLPFPGETIGQVIARKVKEDTPRLRELTPNLSATTVELVERMMQGQVDARPQDYGELLSLIDEALVDRGATARIDIQAAKTPKPSQWTLAASHSAIKWLLAAVAIVACTSFAVSHFLPITQWTPSTPLTPTGWAAPLFDGSTLRGWLPESGQWLPTPDVEGGLVIKGSGTLRRKLPLPDKPQPHGLANYRLTVSCDLATADAAELHFGFVASRSGPRLVLRMEKTQYRLGHRGSESSPFVETATAMRSAKQTRPDEPMYQELRVERHANQWIAFADSKPFATLKPIAGNELAEMGLAADGGSAIFDGPQVTELIQQ